MVQFLHWLGHCDVLAIEPHPVSDIIQWCLSPVYSIEPSHVISCSGQGQTGLICGFVHPGGEFFQGFQMSLAKWLYSKLGVWSSVKHEGGGVHQCMNSVIVGKLSYGQLFVP